MTIGIDPSGRAFRWKVDNSGAIGTDYLVMGCPPMPGDSDEVTLWDDPFAFRTQVCSQKIPADNLPANLITVGMMWHALYNNESNDYSNSAKQILASIRVDSRCPPKSSDATAFAIPNLLSEDAQDALLNALHLYGYTNPVLLWRPIALMLYWLHVWQASLNEVFEKNSDSHVWVLDCDAPQLELTRLSWKPHKSDPRWIAPVRSYPSRKHEMANSLLSVSWNELFSVIPERRQLIIGQTAPSVQSALESGLSSFDVWVCSKHRWKKIGVERPKELPRTCEALKKELLKLLASEHTPPPKPNDICLVHGWLPRLYSADFKEVLKNLWHINDVQIMPSEAVVLGSQFFADRYSRKLPTYYDQLPEYRLWTKNGWRVLVNQDEEVEPGSPWRLTDPELQKSFSIGLHRSDLSFLAQRRPVASPESDYARRLKVSLKQMTNTAIPLHLDIEVKPAQGSAEFVVNALDEEKPFVFDERTQTQTASLSYGLSNDDVSQGKCTTREPEHKGYLEAQPVFGRINDNLEANVRLLKLLVEHCNDLPMSPAFAEVAAAVRRYRFDQPGANYPDIPACLLGALSRWGFDVQQPTRGLLGTKIVENRELSELCASLSAHLWEGMPQPAHRAARNFWSKRQNYCHVFASDTYKNHIRSILIKPDQIFPSWSEAYAPGYVLGELPDDARLLAEYSIARNFDFGEDGYSEKHFWAFFRMLCWHPEVRLEIDFIRRYLTAMIGFINHQPVLNQQTRKYISLDALFALRVRENSGNENFLLDEQDAFLCNTFVNFLSPGGHLAGVPFPPSMLAGLMDVPGNLSDYVRRFILREDTVEDRELGSSIATAD